LWTATSAPCDAAGYRATTTPPAASALPPQMGKLESSPPAPLYSRRLWFVAGLVMYKEKQKWLHTLGNWSNNKDNKIYSIPEHSQQIISDYKKSTK
jgi:hypothetical protein